MWNGGAPVGHSDIADDDTSTSAMRLFSKTYGRQLVIKLEVACRMCRKEYWKVTHNCMHSWQAYAKSRHMTCIMCTSHVSDMRAWVCSSHLDSALVCVNFSLSRSSLNGIPKLNFSSHRPDHLFVCNSVIFLIHSIVMTDSDELVLVKQAIDEGCSGRSRTETFVNSTCTCTSHLIWHLFVNSYLLLKALKLAMAVLSEQSLSMLQVVELFHAATIEFY